jgi:hypothetical protein
MNIGGRTTFSPPTVRHDIDWKPVSGAVMWMPADYREPTVDETTAMRILRCTPRSFASLRDLGLEPTGTPHGPRYDANDIRNAALYSRSGRTEVEMAMSSILSFLRGGDKDLFSERRWAYQMVGTVPGVVAAEGALEPVNCLIYPLSPEAFGGAADPLMTDGGAPTRVGDRVSVPLGVPLRGSMITKGRPGGSLDPLIRAVTEEFLASGVRWHYLSPGLKRDPRAAFARGVGNCDTLCAVLAERLTERGFAASVFRGWIIGITEVPHSWIEVNDDDRRMKVIDPSLLLLARHSSLGCPDFASKAFGATLSRIAPTRCHLDEPIGMTEARVPCEVRLSSRPGGAAPSRETGR